MSFIASYHTSILKKNTKKNKHKKFEHNSSSEPNLYSDIPKYRHGIEQYVELKSNSLKKDETLGLILKRESCKQRADKYLT